MRSPRPVLLRIMRGDERGAILLEYTAVFALVSIAFVLAIVVAVGPNLLIGWTATRTLLLSHKP
jgi:Flp pilus assembly pilin Flp